MQKIIIMIAHVFVDEFGTPALNIEKQGTTPYFVYSGIVIEETEINKARIIHKQIIDTYFQGTHIKSSNISNDDKGHIKRIKILAELSKFKHYVTVLIVDKSKITTDGLSYKRSFLKFFTNLFSKQFLDKFDEYHICIDQTGNNEFQQSVKDYMNDKGYGRQDLFSHNTFSLKEDIKEEPLLQFADFYAGCIGKYYCGKFDKGQAEAINNEIKLRLFVDWFPREFTNYLGAAEFQKNDFCLKISEIAIKTAKDYLENNEDLISCEIIKILLQETHLNPFRPVSSGEIKKKLKLKGMKINDPINEIGKLRDEGVFIVSPLGKKGYKFPCNEKEIAEYYDRITNNVVPQLKRGYVLHKILTEQSSASYNILGTSSFSLLNALIDKVVNHQNSPY